MGEEDRIEEHDIVAVNIHVSKLTLSAKAEVLYIPSATGDSWHFKDLETKQIHYISERCTISLIEKASQ